MQSSRRGVALIYAVFGAFVAGSMVVVMLTAASVTRTKAELKADKLQARYLAEGGVEAAKKVIQSSLANWATPPGVGQVSIGGNQVDYTIETAGDEIILSDAAGMQTVVQPYEIVSSARVGDALVTARRLVNTNATPIFQFMAFYTNDLEIQPGPDMTLSGRVHTNGDLFLGSGNTLSLNTNYVRAAGDMYRRRKDTTDSQGNVRVRKWVANPFDSTEPLEWVTMESRGQMDSTYDIDTESGYDSQFEGFDYDGDGTFTNHPDDWLPFAPGALDRWDEPDGYENGEGNTVLTGEHGVKEAVTANSGSIKMFEPRDGGDYDIDAATGKYVYVGDGNGSYVKGFYHANADLSIIVDPSGAGFTAFDGSGNDVTASVASAVEVRTVFDARQGGNVRVAKVDMRALSTTGAFPANGLLYCSHYGMGTGVNAKGIQLINGSEIYTQNADGTHTPRALTVVTEGSAYIKGNYNTVNKSGCAVIGDAVNLLSNAWNGSKTSSSLPSATATTYNVAMITGNHDTEGTAYNGGLENLPRFHENWNGVQCRISGSFVNTWTSAAATGKWAYGGNRYTAPVRAWAYETAFNRVANLPPFTPMVVTAEDIVSW